MSKIISKEQTDEELAELIRQNDHSAFKQLYYKYFKLLIHFAWYRLHSMDTACDLVQETFYRLWIKRQGLNPNKSVKAYLYKTLTNLIINYRKLSSSTTIPIENCNQEKIEDTSGNLELKFDLLKSLDQLPAKLKTVFMLSRFDGYNYAEIAEICDISKKAVEKRMSKAFSLLRKTFSSKYF